MPRGRYHDGKTARQEDVEVTLTASVLLIVRANAPAEILDSWPVAEIWLVDEDRSQGEARFKRGAAGDARLTVSDAALLAALRGSAPHAKRLSAWRVWAVSIGVGVGLVFFALFAAPLLSAWIAPLVPVSWERKIADSYIGALMSAFGGGAFCTGPDGVAALDDLAARLTAKAKSDYDIRIRVSSHKEINAFAMPGGDIVVFRGLIDFAESPDEVAAVVAHELGHLIHRHPTQALVRAFGFDLFFSFLTGSSILSDLGGQMIALSHSREAEREADALGLRLLGDADLRRDGMERFFERLEKEKGSLPGLLRYFSTHPPTEERAEHAHSDAGGAQALSPEAWRALQHVCD